MESRIAIKLADKAPTYLNKKGQWDFGKSEKRRREIILQFRPVSMPITQSELLHLQNAARREALDKMFAAISKEFRIRQSNQRVQLNLHSCVLRIKLSEK